MRKHYFLLLSILMGTTAFAQRKADVTVPFDQNIQTILLNPVNGEVVVKEKDKISSYNAQTNKTTWVVTEAEIGKTSAAHTANKAVDAVSSANIASLFESDESLAFIPNSPFVKGVINGKDIIINAASGNVVFNSGAKNYRVSSSEFLPESGEFLFVVADGKNINCILYDIEKGNELWTTPLATVDGFIKGLLPFASTPPDQLYVTADFIYSSVKGVVYKLGRADGKLVWSTPFKVSSFYLSQKESEVIVVKSPGGLLSAKQMMNVLNAETGAPLWKDDIKSKKILYLEDWGDRILVAHFGGFNFHKYADGKKMWKKDAAGADFKRVAALGDDYLYVAGKDLRLIDKDGKQLWKQQIKISDKPDETIFYLDKVNDTKIMYLTATKGNIIDYATGKKVWKKDLAFDKERPVLCDVDENTKTCLVYNDKKLYRFDPSATARPEPVAKLKDMKEDKTMAGLDAFDWGICLTGQSDVMGVTTDGAVKYHNTYKEPGKAGRQAQLIGGRLASSFLDEASGVAVTAGVGYVMRGIGSELAGDKSDAKSSIKKAKTSLVAASVLSSASDMVNTKLVGAAANRFNALKQNDKFAFVLTKGETNPLLVKVRKADGTEVDKVEIDNNKPVYEVDAATDNVYYAYKNELRIYNKQ